jgi:hypothetical protein
MEGNEQPSEMDQGYQRKLNQVIQVIDPPHQGRSLTASFLYLLTVCFFFFFPY